MASFALEAKIGPTLDRIKGWETKTMRRVFRFKKKRKMRRGQTIELERQGLLGRYGQR